MGQKEKKNKNKKKQTNEIAGIRYESDVMIYEVCPTEAPDHIVESITIFLHHGMGNHNL